MLAELIAGSRDSQLALVQTQSVITALSNRFPELTVTLQTFKTQGDLILDSALSRIGDKGLFVKELELALLNDSIHFAVHSMKDMPSDVPDGLYLLPFGQRETPQDALVSKNGLDFKSLPMGAVVGTSSLRRQAWLKHWRPDLRVEVIRGNIQTRLRKLDEGPYQALVLAAAGLHRLKLNDIITQLFTPEEMIPACCQGTLAIEFKQPEIADLFGTLADPATVVCTRAERAFLRTMQGGCQLPMGAYARPDGDGRYTLLAMVSDPEGRSLIRESREFYADEAEQAGTDIAQSLLRHGGKDILDTLLHHSS